MVTESWRYFHCGHGVTKLFSPWTSHRVLKMRGCWYSTTNREFTELLFQHVATVLTVPIKWSYTCIIASSTLQEPVQGAADFHPNWDRDRCSSRVTNDLQYKSWRFFQ